MYLAGISFLYLSIILRYLNQLITEVNYKNFNFYLGFIRVNYGRVFDRISIFL